MKKAIMIEESDIKKMISKQYGIPEKNIIKNKYTYTVVLEEEEENAADEG
jgi:hypothetical protein